MAGIVIQLDSFDKLDRQTSAVGRQLMRFKLERQLRPVLFKWGNKFRNQTIRDMKSTNRASWSYSRGKTARHSPSAPGYPPAIDSGELVSNILFGVRSSVLEFGVGRKVKYGVYLEEGTKKMAARPFLNPFIDKYESNILDDIVAVVGIGGSSRSGGLTATFNRIFK